MYAICNLSGQQIKAEPGRWIQVDFMASKKEGEKVLLDEVLLISNGDNITVGKPHLKAKVHATVLAHTRGDKVTVFKKKRRADYHKMHGHHQLYTKLQIDSIEA